MICSNRAMPRRQPKSEQPEAERIRISGGSLRSRLVNCPDTGGVRPMLSRTRMAMFNVLADRLSGAQVWDCFAGSGLLGLECLSRGAAHCVFVERDRRHAAGVRANVQALGVKAASLVIQGSVFDLARPGVPPLPHTPASLLLLDPPHAMMVEQPGQFWPWLERLHETPLAGAGTLACIGHPAELKVPDTVGAFEAIDRREYGTVAFTLLEVIQ
jgi:16S rRNA (guanine966-N2)-methyltransferase